MPSATVAVFPAEAPKAARGSSRQQVSKQFRGTQRLYDETKSLYTQSALAVSVDTMLRAKHRPTVTKLVSLGLGSLTDKSKDQSRRFKQLVILMAIAENLQKSSDVQIFAQDPTFNKTDESFLQSLGVRILRTPTQYDLGEAGHIIDENTLIYSPFLTISAYKLLLESCPVEWLVGDDFNALQLKWEKHAEEHKNLDQLVKSRVSQYQKRVVSGAGFWEESDKPFPMAVYSKKSDRRQKNAGASKKGDAEMRNLTFELAKARL